MPIKNLSGSTAFGDTEDNQPRRQHGGPYLDVTGTLPITGQWILRSYINDDNNEKIHLERPKHIDLLVHQSGTENIPTNGSRYIQDSILPHGEDDSQQNLVSTAGTRTCGSIVGHTQAEIHEFKRSRESKDDEYYNSSRRGSNTVQVDRVGEVKTEDAQISYELEMPADLAQPEQISAPPTAQRGEQTKFEQTPQSESDEDSETTTAPQPSGGSGNRTFGSYWPYNLKLIEEKTEGVKWDPISWDRSEKKKVKKAHKKGQTYVAKPSPQPDLPATRTRGLSNTPQPAKPRSRVASILSNAGPGRPATSVEKKAAKRSRRPATADEFDAGSTDVEEEHTKNNKKRKTDDDIEAQLENNLRGKGSMAPPPRPVSALPGSGKSTGGNSPNVVVSKPNPLSKLFDQDKKPDVSRSDAMAREAQQQQQQAEQSAAQALSTAADLDDDETVDAYESDEDFYVDPPDGLDEIPVVRSPGSAANSKRKHSRSK